MTFDKVVRDLAEEHDISIQQATQQVISATEQNPQSRSEVSPYAATYRTISQGITVTSTYKPQIKYYCQTSEGGGSFRGILKIMDVSINRIYGGVSKQFSGKVYTNLENANRIFWRMDGDFFNNGTMSYNGGVEIKVGQSVTVSFGLSGSSNHYKAVYQEGRTYW